MVERAPQQAFMAGGQGWEYQEQRMIKVNLDDHEERCRDALVAAPKSKLIHVKIRLIDFIKLLYK
jgi:hypothetical protein